MRESPIASYLRRRHLPLQATPVRLLGVETMLLPTGDGGDLYVTWDGLHRLDYLLLENWLEPAWFQAKRERLPGTSTVYRLPTKPVNGHSNRPRREILPGRRRRPLGYDGLQPLRQRRIQ